MPVTYKFNEEQIEELKSAQKRNKDKNVEKRLNALLLRAEGKSRKEVAYITGYKYTHITQLTTKYMQKGLKAITDNHYKGNCRNMTYEQEETLLEKFKKSSENGQIVETSEIKEAYDKAIGHKTGRSQIYYMLHRHGWRKVMPRSKHPKKADEEAIKASKKLNLN